MQLPFCPKTQGERVSEYAGRNELTQRFEQRCDQRELARPGRGGIEGPYLFGPTDDERITMICLGPARLWRKSGHIGYAVRRGLAGCIAGSKCRLYDTWEHGSFCKGLIR